MKQAETGRQRRRSEQEKTAIIAAYKVGGQTQAAFCRAYQISVPTLSAWLKQVRERGQSDEAKARLIEVSGIVHATVGSVGEVVIEVGSGVSVRAPAGLSVEWLCTLIGGLRCGG